MIYTALIQTMLCLLATVFVLCELTPQFSNSVYSILARFSVAISLIVLAFYAQYLKDSPNGLALAALLASVGLTTIVAKYILGEYMKRMRKKQVSK